MKLSIDTEHKTLELHSPTGPEVIPLYSKRSFEILSDVWLKVGWEEKSSYTFTWLGRPIIQLPEDAFRIQEVIFQVKPDLIIETGVANGGSLIYYASLCKALERGRVIGIDIEIRPHNRKAIESHPLASFIRLLEGSSTDPQIVAQARAGVKADDRVLVLLDSCHTRDHVAAELEAYYSLVSVGSYIVATDGIMRDLSDVSRGQPDWVWDNPVNAAVAFAQRHPEFVIEQPKWLFNESQLSRPITYWPSAYLKRVR